MKKIYAKFTRERSLQFQVETAVYQQKDGTKWVKKHPMVPECEVHLEQIYQNYCFFSAAGKELYAPCKKEGKSVAFPFITGESYYKRLLRKVESHDRKAFYQILAEYRQLVDQLYQERESFTESELFVQILGSPSPVLQGLPAAKKLDIDLTFDNIIIKEDSQVQVIDYEWMFDCPVPLKFVYFRSIKAFFMKNHILLEQFLTIEEVYDFMGITPEELAAFEDMNQHFMIYVNGGEAAYETFLQAYKKSPEEFNRSSNTRVAQALVFIDGGEGYTADQCILTAYPDEKQIVKMEIDLTAYEHIQEVRIDPADVSTAIRMLKFEMEGPDGLTLVTMDQLRHNGMKGPHDQDIWIFNNDDPQILLPLTKDNRPWRLFIEFQVLYINLEEFDEYLNLYKEKLRINIQAEQRLLQLTTVQQEKMAALDQRNAHLEQQNTLLRDKLKYLKSTWVYQKMLEKKVNALSLWDEIED